MVLFNPMAAMVFYIFGIAVFNFITRKKAIRNKTLRLGYFNTLDVATYQPPEYVVRVGRHFDNQFQLPMIFFVTCLVGLHFHLHSWVLAVAAWAFIVMRMVHTYIHLGSNHILKRAIAYAMGWIFILIMWASILFEVSLLR